MIRRILRWWRGTPNEMPGGARLVRLAGLPAAPRRRARRDGAALPAVATVRGCATTMRGLTWSGGRHAFPGGGGIGGPSGLAPYTADEFPTLPGEWRQLRDDLGLIDDDGDEEWLTDLGRRVAERLLPCPFCGAAG